MSPKFRGNADDWLDNEQERTKLKRSRPPRSGKEKVSLPSHEANALVTEVFPNQCRVVMDSGASKLCSYRKAQVQGLAEYGGEFFRERAPVAVGDRVKVDEQDAAVMGVCRRTNVLIRPSPDREERSVHVIASNIDHLVIVDSVREPDFSPGLVDRFLIAAAVGGIIPVICVNKIDLVSEPAHPWAYYRGLGVKVVELSAKYGHGIDSMFEMIKAGKAVFCGHSGVGKTSLIGALLGCDAGRVGEVSGYTGKGRHTTSRSVMLDGPAGAKWIDTPGVREFGLAGVRPETLGGYFTEFAALGCTVSGCRHYNESDCQARGLPRYPSYRRIYESLMSGGW